MRAFVKNNNNQLRRIVKESRCYLIEISHVLITTISWCIETILLKCNFETRWQDDAAVRILRRVAVIRVPFSSWRNFRCGRIANIIQNVPTFNGVEYDRHISPYHPADFCPFIPAYRSKFSWRLCAQMALYTRIRCDVIVPTSTFYARDWHFDGNSIFHFGIQF